MALLFGFSSRSSVPSLPAGLSYYDAHIAAYAGLAVLTSRAAAGGLWRVTPRAVLVAVLISTLYGVSDEYHQVFVPGRTFEVLDMIADAAGSVIGASGAWACSIIRRRTETRDAL